VIGRDRPAGTLRPAVRAQSPTAPETSSPPRWANRGRRRRRDKNPVRQTPVLFGQGSLELAAPARILSIERRSSVLQPLILRIHLLFRRTSSPRALFGIDVLQGDPDVGREGSHLSFARSRKLAIFLGVRAQEKILNGHLRPGRGGAKRHPGQQEDRHAPSNEDVDHGVSFRRHRGEACIDQLS